MIEHPPTQTRDEILAELRTMAVDLFARNPKARSVMLSVAQYWNDEADDATHSYLVASERDTPCWPHDCDDAGTEEFSVTGESCSYCGSELGYLESWDDNGMSIVGFAAYCHEHGSQEEPTPECYLPYAIARRTEGGVEIEIVGALLRPWDELLPMPAREKSKARARPFDARAITLLAECAGDDLAPRRVLADYLLEQEDPRGEYISLALAEDLDADSIARRDALFAEHHWSWIAPLPDVVPAGGARFEHGLLAHAEVWAPSDEAVAAVRGAPVWATVRSVRYLGEDGRCVLHPTMRALREVSNARLPTLETLARGEWPIERLHAILDDAPAIEKLASARGLSRLCELTFVTARRDDARVETALSRLRAAAWWKQLASLTVLAPFEKTRELLATEVGVPRFAIAEVYYGDRPAGWQFALDRTGSEPRLLVSLAGYSARSNRATLAEHLDQLVDVRTYLVRSPRWQPNEDDVAVLSRSGRGISLA